MSFLGVNSFKTLRRQGMTWAWRSRKSGTTYSENFPTVSAVASLTMNYTIRSEKFYYTYTRVLKSLDNEHSHIIDVFLNHLQA